MKRTSFVLMIALATTPTALAQHAQGSGSGAGTGQGRVSPVAPTARTVEVTRNQAVNVRLELTITDQSGGGQPEKKTITMLVADGFDGRVRAANVVTEPSTASRYNVQLNADAAVSLVADDKVRARITVEYSAAGTAVFSTSDGSNFFNPPTGLNETVTVILANGKPTVITQSADPATDRKVTLEATATIVR
jgi:hypothetical protein